MTVPVTVLPASTDDWLSVSDERLGGWRRIPCRRQDNGNLKSVNTAVGFCTRINCYADRNRNRACCDLESPHLLRPLE